MKIVPRLLRRLNQLEDQMSRLFAKGDWKQLEQNRASFIAITTYLLNHGVQPVYYPTRGWQVRWMPNVVES